MPRVDQVYAREERAYLQRMLSGPRFLYVTTEIQVHERNDVPGRECPCCGSEDAWSVGTEHDLDVLVDTSRRSRRNAWAIMEPEGRARFEAFAKRATPLERAGPEDVGHVPIVYRCAEDRVDELRDDSTETIYWSGGWRSGKTFQLDQWWTRGWMKFGGQGVLFWLVGPELRHAWKMMRKIFYGRPGAEGGRSTPSILPTTRDRETGEPMPILANGLPEKHTSSDMAFSWIDGSRTELYHTRTLGQLEGDDVQRIAMDEVTRMKTGDAYKICRGRVTQCGGQVGLASVPDDDGEWVFTDVVSPFEAGTAKHKLVLYYSTHANVWLSPENAQRLEDGETDPIVVEQKIKGLWARHGAFEYSEVWGDGEAHCEEILSHEAAAWGFGTDITADLVRQLFGRPAAYIGARDFNFVPQTGLMAKVFGELADWKTWHVVVVDEFVLRRADARMAAAQNSKARDGLYNRAGLFCDANAFWDGHRYGGHASKTSDAFEFEQFGFQVQPPARTTKGKRAKGDQARNPEIPASRRLVRQLLHEKRLHFAKGGCPLAIKAMPRVPYGRKPRNKSHTALDAQIWNIDDALRYLVWPLLGKQMVPGRKRGRTRIRSGSTDLARRDGR